MTPFYRSCLLSLCIGLLVMGGCSDDADSGPDAGAPKPAPWRRVDGIEPLEVSQEPAGHPRWFRRDGQADPVVAPADVQVDLEVLHEQSIVPAAQEMTVKVAGAEVAIAPGAIDQPETLVIARARKPAALPIEGFEAVDSWQVSLGERHVFAQPLTMRFTLPAAAAQKAGQRRQPLAAMHYNPQAQAWVYTPVTFDAATGQATIRTRHLTLFTIVLRPVNNLIHNAVYTDHFAIFYGKADILADAEIGEKPWADHLLKDLDAHGEPVGVARQIDAITIEIEGQTGVPTYIVYMAKALEYAWHRYKDLGLKVPEWTRTDIYVGVNSPLSDDSHRGKLLGTIEIAPSATWKPTTVRIGTAHEFFHTVQAEYLGLAIMSMNYRAWWLEALAEYAPQTVWGQTVPQKGMKPNFFHLPLPTVDDSHEYGCSQFVRFLVTRKNIAFKELVVETLDVPARLLAMEEISAPDFALFKKLLGIDGPFDDYTAAVTCGVIDRLLRRRGSTLTDAYAEFAAWALFDDGCKALVPDGDHLLRFAAGHSTIGGLALNDEKIEQPLSTAPHGTAAVWAVAIENPLADASAPKPPRKVTVEVDGEVPALTRVDVYVLKYNQRLAGGLKPAGTLRGPGNPSANVAVGAKDILYLVAANASHKPADVKVRVLGGLDFRIEPAEVDPLEPGREVTFTAVSDSLPKSLLPSRLEVRWTPVWGVREKTSVKAVGSGFSSAYTYAWLHKGDYTLLAELLDDGQVIASAKVPLKVLPLNEPSITLEARAFTAPAAQEFSISASVANAPTAATFQWQINSSKAIVTTSPQCRFTVPSAGEYRISVKMLTPDGRLVASDAGSLTVEPGTDLVWIEDTDIRKGETVVLRKYQVFRGTSIKHGQWLDYYTDGAHDGSLEARKAFENNVCRKSEAFYPNGTLRQIEHFDGKGRYHGERSVYLEDGRRVLTEQYVEGVKNGPYEILYSSGNSYTRHSGRHLDGKISGTLTLHSGNTKSGTEYHWKTQEYLDGKLHGNSVVYLPDGRKSGEMEYRNGKPHGWSKSWYTSEVGKGIYYLMTETLFEEGKAVQERRLNSKGEVVSDKKIDR